MARRKRAGFGSTSRFHRAEAETQLPYVKSGMRAARTNLAARDCGAAITRLVHAAYHAGIVKHERMHSGKPVHRAGVDVPLFALTRKIAAKCKIAH